jgi:hypothetical protein
MVVIGRIFSRPSKATRLRAKEDIVSAAHAYAVALSLETDNSDGHLQIGHLHKVKGDTQKAAQSYKSALKLNPGNSDAAKELRALGASDQELASIIDGGQEDRRNIGLSPVDRGLAATPSAREHSQPAAGREDRSTLEPAERLPTVVDMSSAPKEFSPQVGKLATISTIPQQRKLVAQGGPPIGRRKWGSSLAAVIIVLSLVSGGALMLMAPPIEIAQDAYRRALTEMQRRTARENAEAETTARKAAEEKALAKEAERKAAEEKLAAEASARRHEEEAQQAAEEMARAEAARKTAEARAAARGDARLKAEEAARKAEEGKPKSDAEIRQKAERAEAGLNLSEQDRKRVQVALNSLGHEIPTATGYFGPRTRAMIKAWQKTQGLPETGYLTEIQLATLRQQAAPALAKYDQAHRNPKED